MDKNIKKNIDTTYIHHVILIIAQSSDYCTVRQSDCAIITLIIAQSSDYCTVRQSDCAIMSVTCLMRVFYALIVFSNTTALR